MYPLNKSTSLQTVGIAQQIANHLQAQIIRGDIPAGARLKEMTLAKEFGVSTNTLREALREIAKTQLVVIEPRKGTMVSEITAESISHLYQFLFLQLAQLVTDASRNWQNDDLKSFVDLVHRMYIHYNNNAVEEFHNCAFDFVYQGLNFTDNYYLRSTIEQYLPLLRRYSYLALALEAEELEISMKIFQRLIKHLARREEKKAAKDIRIYGEHQRKILIEALNKKEESKALPKTAQE